MATLLDLRDLLRKILNDETNTGNVHYRWSDDDASDHLLRSMRMYNAYVPHLAVTNASVGANSRLILWGNLTIGHSPPLAVEYPTNQAPPALLPFTHDSGSIIRLILETPPTEDYQVAVHYQEALTYQYLPANHEYQVVEGAAGYAMTHYGLKLIQRFGQLTPLAEFYQQTGGAYLAAYSQFLALARTEARTHDALANQIIPDIDQSDASALRAAADAISTGLEHNVISRSTALQIYNRFARTTGDLPSATDAIAAAGTAHDKARSIRYLVDGLKDAIQQGIIGKTTARDLFNNFAMTTGAPPTPAETSITAGSSAELALALQRLGNALDDFIKRGVMDRQTARQLLNTFASTTGDAPAEDPSVAAGDAFSWED